MLKKHPQRNTYKSYNKGWPTMCICDSKYFKVTNTTTDNVKLYKRAASIARRFDCSKDWVFYCLRRDNVCICRGGVRFSVEVNKHPECVKVRNDIIREYGVRLGKMTDRYRHMLPEHRQ